MRIQSVEPESVKPRLEKTKTLFSYGACIANRNGPCFGSSENIKCCDIILVEDIEPGIGCNLIMYDEAI